MRWRSWRATQQKIAMSAIVYASIATNCRPASRCLEHRVEPPRDSRVAVDGVGHLFRRGEVEVMRLAEKRSEARHLPHQPFLDFDPLALVVPGIEAAEFPRQVEEDRPRFEDRDRRAAGPLRIPDRGNLVVGRHRRERRRPLLPLADVDEGDRVGNAEFLEHDGDLPAVRRRPVEDLDREGLYLHRRRVSLA